MAKPADNWRMRLRKARDLRNQGVAMVYERAVLMQANSKDPEYLESFDGDEARMLDALSDEFRDLCVSGWSQVALLLEYFPEKSQWENRDLHKMLAEAMDYQEKKRRASSTRRAPPQRVKKEEFERVVREKENAEAKAVQLAEAVETEREELLRLREENDRLKRELMEARAEIRALKSVMNRDLQVA